MVGNCDDQWYWILRVLGSGFQIFSDKIYPQIYHTTPHQTASHYTTVYHTTPHIISNPIANMIKYNSAVNVKRASNSSSKM